MTVFPFGFNIEVICLSDDLLSKVRSDLFALVEVHSLKKSALQFILTHANAPQDFPQIPETLILIQCLKSSVCLFERHIHVQVNTPSYPQMKWQTWQRHKNVNTMRSQTHIAVSARVPSFAALFYVGFLLRPSLNSICRSETVWVEELLGWREKRKAVYMVSEGTSANVDIFILVSASKGFHRDQGQRTAARGITLQSSYKSHV